MDSCFLPLTTALFPDIMELKMKVSVPGAIFLYVKQTVIVSHPLNKEHSFHNYSYVYCLHMAGPLYPADLAMYLLPYKTQCSKSEAFLQGSSLNLLFPALFIYIKALHDSLSRNLKAFVLIHPFLIKICLPKKASGHIAFVRQSSLGFPVLHFQMVENPTDSEVQNQKDVTEGLNSNIFYLTIASDLGLYFINTLKCKKHTNQVFLGN